MFMYCLAEMSFGVSALTSGVISQTEYLQLTKGQKNPCSYTLSSHTHRHVHTDTHIHTAAYFKIIKPSSPGTPHTDTHTNMLTT